MKRHVLLFPILLSGLSAASAQPNIIQVMVDDLGWNHISAAPATMSSNHPAFSTPNLEKLAANGVSFTHCYSQPNCAPSRAAILSGQYPARTTNDVYNVGNLNRYGKGLAQGQGYSKEEAQFIGPQHGQDVAAEAITIAEALKENGYATAHIGKYHAGGRTKNTLPEHSGFDINIGGFYQGHQPTCFGSATESGNWQFKGVGRGDFDPYAAPYTAEYLQRHDMPALLEGEPKHITDAVADAMEDTLAQLTSNEQPFYLQLHPYAVHAPIDSRKDLIAAAKARTAKLKHNAPTPYFKYVAFIEGVDQLMGRLLKALDDPNTDGDTSDSITNNTIILFMSDNGGVHANNAPHRGEKGMFTDGGIRVPLIAHWPGVIPAGTVHDKMLHFVDFYPTYLELAGNQWTPSPDVHPLDGTSFAQQLKQPQLNRQREPIYYLFPGYMDRRAQPCAVIIQERGEQRYKLLYFYETNHHELYCLTDDIGEANNLFQQQPELASEMSQQLHRWLTKQEPSWKPKFPINKASGKSVGPPPVL